VDQDRTDSGKDSEDTDCEVDVLDIVVVDEIVCQDVMESESLDRDPLKLVSMVADL
jgi:hypothetical protein